MNANLESDLFLDTNILVYAYDRSAGSKHTISQKLVEDCWVNGNGCLSLQVLQEFYVTVTQKITSRMDYQTARQILADLATWRLHSPEASDLLQAIDLQQHYKLSFWDAMVVQSAARLGCKQIFSEDLSDGQNYGDVKVINPFLNDSSIR
jgi:predicted nucleic acid-binding protein